MTDFEFDNIYHVVVLFKKMFFTVLIWIKKDFLTIFKNNGYSYSLNRNVYNTDPSYVYYKFHEINNEWD